MTDDRRPNPPSGVQGYPENFPAPDETTVFDGQIPTAGWHLPAPRGEDFPGGGVAVEWLPDDPGAAGGGMPPTPQEGHFGGGDTAAVGRVPAAAVGRVAPAPRAGRGLRHGGEGFIDLGVTRGVPVTHRGRRRSRRVAAAWAAAIGAVLGGGVGYAVLRDPKPPAPVVSAPGPAETAGPGLLFGQDEPGEPAEPGLSPVATMPTVQAVPTTTTARPRVTTAPTTVPAAPPTTEPVAVAPPSTGPAPSATPVFAPVLSASFRYEVDDQSGYRATISVSNPDSARAGDWTVRLTVPGGNEVTIWAGDVVVAQNGAAVTFTPAPGAATIPGGGSAEFTFGVVGVLESLPDGCTIDGRACD